jgi:hypothetical protein
MREGPEREVLDWVETDSKTRRLRDGGRWPGEGFKMRPFHQSILSYVVQYECASIASALRSRYMYVQYMSEGGWCLWAGC